MTKLFSTEGGIYRLMQRLYSMLILTILFLLSCLPVVTIGAAITAAYGTAYKLIDHEEEVLYQTYFRSFKQSFASATILWLGLLAAIFFALFNMGWIRTFVLSNTIAYYGAMLLLTFFLLMLLYLFPLIARFENTLPATMVNALILSLKHLPYSIIVFLIVGLGTFVLPLFLPQLFFLWLFIGAGSIIYVTALIFNKIFRLYQ